MNDVVDKILSILERNQYQVILHKTDIGFNITTCNIKTLAIGNDLSVSGEHIFQDYLYEGYIPIALQDGVHKFGISNIVYTDTLVTKDGNKKMFLDTTWAHPFEQTWMSHMYQLVKKGELYPGLLLMTPTEHDRFEHYERSLRKES